MRRAGPVTTAPSGSGDRNRTELARASKACGSYEGARCGTTLSAVRISIAMAARNATAFLDPLLESLARQTHLPYEIVAVDDGSTDATSERLAPFGPTAPFPVRVVRSDRSRGHVAAFLEAARLTEGDAVAFCDSDDVWLDDKLAKCATALARDSTVLVQHATRLVDAELRDLGGVWPQYGSTRTVPRLGLTGLAIDAPGMGMV